MAKVTKEQIEEFKKNHGKVFHFEVDSKECYLRKPDRKVLSLAMKSSQKNPLAFNEVILRHCWLAGDMEIQTDDELFMSISQELDKLVDQKMVDVKEL
jgi:hypothetical protein